MVDDRRFTEKLKGKLEDLWCLIVGHIWRKRFTGWLCERCNIFNASNHRQEPPKRWQG